MDPASLIPLSEPIPVPGSWFDVLLVGTFVIHLLFMNAAVGATAVALFSPVTGQGNAKPISGSLTVLMALAINFGVAPFLFLQVNYGHYDYVSSVLMGGWWLAVIGLLILGYYALYLYKFKYDKLAGSGRIFTAFALVILLWIGFMFTNNMTLMIDPEVWGEYFTQGVFLNWADSTLLPRWLHMMCAALAVGGLFTALLANKRGDAVAEKRGLNWFTRATLVNLAFGVWFLISLPQPVMLKFMGGSVPATIFLVLALVAAGLTLADGFMGKTWRTAYGVVITIILMAITRHYLRRFSLEPWKDTLNLEVTGQYSPLVMFLVALVIGLALVWWMVKIAINSKTGGKKEA